MHFSKKKGKWSLPVVHVHFISPSPPALTSTTTIDPSALEARRRSSSLPSDSCGFSTYASQECNQRGRRPRHRKSPVDISQHRHPVRPLKTHCRRFEEPGARSGEFHFLLFFCPVAKRRPFAEAMHYVLFCSKRKHSHQQSHGKQERLRKQRACRSFFFLQLAGVHSQSCVVALAS